MSAPIYLCRCVTCAWEGKLVSDDIDAVHCPCCGEADVVPLTFLAFITPSSLLQTAALRLDDDFGSAFGALLPEKC